MDPNLDRDLWRIVYQSIRHAAGVIHSPGRRPVYSPRLIVAMYCWAVFHDQCLSWACNRRHYHSLFRPRQLPSVSQFTRRIKSEIAQSILQRVHTDLARRGVPLPLSYLDGKPLLVSNVSNTPTRGRAISAAPLAGDTSCTLTSTRIDASASGA